MRVVFHIAALLLCLPTMGMAGARYKLAYKVKTNDLIRMVAQAADLKRMESAGDEIVIDGAKMLVKGEKTGFILDLARNELILLDHENKTFEKMTPAAMKERIGSSFPPGVEGLLRGMFPAVGKPMTEVKVEPLGEVAAPKLIDQFRLRFGLVYLLPGVDSIAAFTPHIEKRISELGKAEASPMGLRFAIGSGGKVLDAEVRLIDYQEIPVPASRFAPPSGYALAQ
jgi:hypothetical protein